MIYYFQFWHPIEHISENIESQWTLKKQQMFLHFTITLFWISGKGWLTSSRSIPDLSSPIAPAYIEKVEKLLTASILQLSQVFF